MVILAELNENNIVIGLKMVKSMIDDQKHVEIDSMNDDLLFRKYENGQWSEEKFLPPEPPLLPSIEEQILAENQYQTALLEITMMGAIYSETI